MEGSSLRVGTALLLASLLTLPASGTTVPEYAVTKLDAHFSTLNALQALVDLFAGRDPTQGSANTSTTRWSILLGNSYNLSRVLVSSALAGGGMESTAVALDVMADPGRCVNCTRNISLGLAAIGNNSSSIFGDPAGTTGRARMWREYRAYLAATDAANASRNASRLVQLQTSLIRDALTLYTENLKNTYSILGL
ncbi:MAG: hypothetical protein QXO51_07955 [Halobacteria archaeon]